LLKIAEGTGENKCEEGKVSFRNSRGPRVEKHGLAGEGKRKRGSQCGKENIRLGIRC